MWVAASLQVSKRKYPILNEHLRYILIDLNRI